METIGPREVIGVGAERLDHLPDAVAGPLLDHLPNLLGCFGAVQLNCSHPSAVGDREHPSWQFVPEDADRQHIGGQTARDVVDMLRHHLAR